MADLKVGTTVGGSPVWHQGNLALVPSGNAILYKGARIYSENDKPSANELQVVSRAGDTMTGMLNVETSTEYPLALKSSVSGPAYIRFSKGNTLQSYVGTDAAGDFKVAMTDVNGSWAFDGLKIAKSNGDVSLRGALVSTNAGNFDIKYGNVQFIRANSSKHVYIGAPGGTDLVLGYAQDGMTTTKIRIDSAVYNKTGGLLISDAGLIQRSAMDNPYYNQTESDSRFIRLNTNTVTNGYLLSRSSDMGTPHNLSMGYSGFFRHNSQGGFSGLTINVSHPSTWNGAHSRGITFDYGSTGYGMYTYAYDSAGNKLANQKIYTEADKPTPAEIGALAAGANAVSASKLQTARTISLTGGATGSVSFDGSANVSLAVSVTNDSHTHSDYVKKIGDSMSGNLTVPKVLLSAAQGTEANAVARRDFVESTVTASGKGVKDLTIALPAGAPETGYIPVLFKTNGASNSFVFIDTLSSGASHPMNNCSFLGNVRAGARSDCGSYAVGQFTIYDVSERAIHSIHRPYDTVDGFVVYVETRAFPITVRVDIGTTVTAHATDVTFGASVFTVNGQVSGNTKTVVLANFDKGTGTYNGSNRVYDNGYNPTPEAVGALPVNGNAVTASRLQTARLIAGVPFDGTSNISISATNVGALPVDANAVSATKLLTARTINGTNFDGTANITTANWGTARTLTVGNAAKSVNGSGNVSWSLSEIGALSASGGGIAGDFWRADGDRQFGLVKHLGLSTDVAGCLVLLAKKYVGTLINKTGFVGRILFSRGSATAISRTDFVDVSVSVAYDSNLVRLLRRSGANVAAAKIVEVTYNSEVYFALYRPAAGRGEVIATGHAFNANLPLLISDANNYSITDVVTTEEDYHVGNKPTVADVGAVAKAGDTMTGNLTAPKVLVSGAQGAEVNALTRKDYVDSAIAAGDALQVSKTGDTMTGNLRFSQEKTGISLHSTADVTGIYNGTGDGASRDVTNLQIKSWYGIGISPTAGLPAGMTMGQNSIWINARNGDISAIGNITANKSLVSAAQGTEANALTRKDYVDSQVATRAPTTHTHTVAAITDLRPQDANATANTLVLRDGSADVNARLLRTTYADEPGMSGAIAFRVNNSTNNYTRYCSNPGPVRDWMKGAKTNWDMNWRAYIEHADNPMTEYHIPGKTAVITYLTGDGNYRITSSNGAGGAVADRLRVDASGNLFSGGMIHEAGQRVYSPNNPPPKFAYQFQGERWVGDSIPLTNGAEIVLTEDVRGRMGRSQILDNGLNVQVMIQFPVIDSIFSVAQGNDHTVFELYGYGRRLKRLRGWGEGGPWQGFWVFT